VADKGPPHLGRDRGRGMFAPCCERRSSRPNVSTVVAPRAAARAASGAQRAAACGIADTGRRRRFGAVGGEMRRRCRGEPPFCTKHQRPVGGGSAALPSGGRSGSVRHASLHSPRPMMVRLTRSPQLILLAGMHASVQVAGPRRRRSSRRAAVQHAPTTGTPSSIRPIETQKTGSRSRS
jgi:hypothetical protein